MRVVFACFMLLLLLPAAARAQPQEERPVIGTIQGVEGAAYILDPEAADKPPRPATAEAALYTGETVETGVDSRAFILLIDDSQITLGANASFRIDEYLLDDGEAVASKGRFTAVRGAFEFVTGLIGKAPGADVSVNFPYGSIGVRGTTFWGGEIDGAYGVLVSEGEVIVSNARGRARVPKGHGTMIRGATMQPDKPKIWTAGKMKDAGAMIALKNRPALANLVKAKAAFNENQRQQLKTHLKQRVNPQAPAKGPVRRIINQPIREPAVKDGAPERRSEIPGVLQNQQNPAASAARPAGRAAPLNELNKPFTPEERAKYAPPPTPDATVIPAEPEKKERPREEKFPSWHEPGSRSGSRGAL